MVGVVAVAFELATEKFVGFVQVASPKRGSLVGSCVLVAVTVVALDYPLEGGCDVVGAVGGGVVAGVVGDVGRTMMQAAHGLKVHPENSDGSKRGWTGWVATAALRMSSAWAESIRVGLSSRGSPEPAAAHTPTVGGLSELASLALVWFAQAPSSWQGFGAGVAQAAERATPSSWPRSPQSAAAEEPRSLRGPDLRNSP